MAARKTHEPLKAAKRRKAQRLRRQRMRSKGICRRCKNKVEPERRGKVLCEKCKDLGSRQVVNWRHTKVVAWKALGLCCHCNGQRLAMIGRNGKPTTQCAYCYENDYERREIKISKTKAAGVCARCCDPDAIHGYFKSTGKKKKYCIKCLEKYNNQPRRLKSRALQHTS